MPDEPRTSILAELARYTGKRVSAAFIKRTANFIPYISRFHNLITGIYKPAWSDYALSIVMKPGSPYENKDEVVFLEDGRWLMTYSPRSGGLNVSDNKALLRCMKEKIPLGIFKQLTDKTDHQHGSTYLVLGLGLITNYDSKADVFIVESADQIILEQVSSVIADEETRYEVQLYARLTNQFRLFSKEERGTYTVSAPKREEAFRQVVLREYDFACAICDTKFHLDDHLIEATAAHIVPKKVNGTDDPRNGLALCRTHHWAFDAGIFTLTEKYEVQVSPIINRAETRNFRLREMAGNSIRLPMHEIIRPHASALDWHRQNIFKA